MASLDEEIEEDFEDDIDGESSPANKPQSSGGFTRIESKPPPSSIALSSTSTMSKGKKEEEEEEEEEDDYEEDLEDFEEDEGVMESKESQTLLVEQSFGDDDLDELSVGQESDIDDFDGSDGFAWKPTNFPKLLYIT